MQVCVVDGPEPGAALPTNDNPGYAIVGEQKRAPRAQG